MVKIAIDAGHGINTPGKRTPAGEREWSFNNKVVLAAIKYLNEYQNVSILRLDDPTGKTDVPLTTRTNKANQWGADILISDHHNANTGVWGSWTGTETYTYIGSWPQAEKLARLVHKHILKAYGLRDRGLKKANFHMLRESKMPAILIEGGYMDSTIDIKKLRDNKVLDAAGKAIAQGVAEYFGLKKKAGSSTSPSKPATPSGGGSYKVNTSVPGYTTAADAKSGKNKKTTVKAGSYHIYKQANGMLNVTSKQGVPGSWINPADNKTATTSKPASNKTFRIRVKAASLWYYNKPDWNARKATVKKGEVFTVVDTLTVAGSKMYKLKSGNYITANPQYVEKI